jgi:hypothetical protein
MTRRTDGRTDEMTRTKERGTIVQGKERRWAERASDRVELSRNDGRGRGWEGRTRTRKWEGQSMTMGSDEQARVKMRRTWTGVEMTREVKVEVEERRRRRQGKTGSTDATDHERLEWTRKRKRKGVEQGSEGEKEEQHEGMETVLCCSTDVVLSVASVEVVWV